MSSVLADLLTGADVASRYRGTPVITRLKARDVELAALGDVHTEVGDLEAEVLCLTDPTRGRYAKLVVREDKVAGAIVLGAPDAAAMITQIYERGIPVPADRLALLLGRAMPDGGDAKSDPVNLPASSIVCQCNLVSKSQLVAAWRRGDRGVSELAVTTRATTGCGSCRYTVCSIAEWLSNHSGEEIR